MRFCQMILLLYIVDRHSLLFSYVIFTLQCFERWIYVSGLGRTGLTSTKSICEEKPIHNHNKKKNKIANRNMKHKKEDCKITAKLTNPRRQRCHHALAA